jgi:alkylhydroperoxidase family enzyme
MTEPRVPLLSLDDARAAGAEVGISAGLAELSVFRVLLRHPALAEAVHDLLATLLWKGRLDPRLRELLILRIAWRTGSVYEWTQHWRVARMLEIPDEDLLAVRDWERGTRFDERERAVLAATDETLDAGAISAPTWTTLARELDEVELIELVAAIGNWRLFAALLESLEIPLETGVDPWPPDGRGPSAHERGKDA